METLLADRIKAALVNFSCATRLYSLTIQHRDVQFGPAQLLVEAFTWDETVQGIGICDVIALSTDAHIVLEQLLDQEATLDVKLADGSCASFGGEISEAAMLGSDGGLARYRLRLSPWLHRLAYVRNSRVWQEKSVVDIVESVFSAYLPRAIWRWSDEVEHFMSGSLPRSYCCQYRQSDLSFVRRLLTEEGLGWRFEQTVEGAGVVLFADSTQLGAFPKDPSSAADDGIRFHNARAGERQDTVQALRLQRTICAALTTVVSYDYKSKRVIAASSPSALQSGTTSLSVESFDVPGQYAFANTAQARRYADLHMQGREARSQLWQGRSTLRTLRAGTRMTIRDVSLQQLGEAPAFSVLRVMCVGVNNLPLPAQHALAELFGPIPETLAAAVATDQPEDFALVLEQALKSGYANWFEAVLADVVWRSRMCTGARLRDQFPTAAGSQTAIVVGAEGGDQPNGADELYCDRLGRVRIRFHWQADTDATCWVRVAQRSAGGGMGSQFLPRIGQEVLVQFLEGDIDRPVIVGAMYNGQGEGGIAPMPGERGVQVSQASSFAAGHDALASAQGNLAAGNSPVWHGASSDSAGHRNGAAQWGVRTKEFGGSGYNQLLFDDTDAQGRVQLKSTHAASELNLGHLLHSADNYRGSFRGKGAELRTDDYGALRAGAGLFISSYKLLHNGARRDPAGDNVPSIAMLRRAVITTAEFSKVAENHKTVALAAAVGAEKAGESTIDDQAAPMKSLLRAVSGMVSHDSAEAAEADALEKKTGPGDGMLPHASSAIIAMAAQAGLGVAAGQSVQLASGETVTLMSGTDMQLLTGGQMRLHARQAIGVLGGASAPGEGTLGLQLIAGKGRVDVQSQADSLHLQARDEVNVMSANAHIDWAAAKSISMSTAGGANITIEGGNITIQCPGKIMIHAGAKKFSGPEQLSLPMPELPRSICLECLRKSLAAAPAFTVVG